MIIPVANTVRVHDIPASFPAATLSPSVTATCRMLVAEADHFTKLVSLMVNLAPCRNLLHHGIFPAKKANDNFSV